MHAQSTAASVPTLRCAIPCPRRRRAPPRTASEPVAAETSVVVTTALGGRDREGDPPRGAARQRRCTLLGRAHAADRGRSSHHKKASRRVGGRVVSREGPALASADKWHAHFSRWRRMPSLRGRRCHRPGIGRWCDGSSPSQRRRTTKSGSAPDGARSSHPPESTVRHDWQPGKRTEMGGPAVESRRSTETIIRGPRLHWAHP
jgi:hypothetical protein